jgi:hypothetical protein
MSASTEGIGVLGSANAATGLTIGVAGWSGSTQGIAVRGEVGAVSAIPIVARGAAGQTANLQEWQNDAGKPLAVIDKDGNLGIGSLRIAKDGNNFAFLNADGTKIAVLDSGGNLLLKGKVNEKAWK